MYFYKTINFNDKHGLIWTMGEHFFQSYNDCNGVHVVNNVNNIYYYKVIYAPISNDGDHFYGDILTNLGCHADQITIRFSEYSRAFSSEEWEVRTKECDFCFDPMENSQGQWLMIFYRVDGAVMTAIDYAAIKNGVSITKTNVFNNKYKYCSNGVVCESTDSNKGIALIKPSFFASTSDRLSILYKVHSGYGLKVDNNEGSYSGEITYEVFDPTTLNADFHESSDGNFYAFYNESPACFLPKGYKISASSPIKTGSVSNIEGGSFIFEHNDVYLPTEVAVVVNIPKYNYKLVEAILPAPLDIHGEAEINFGSSDITINKYGSYDICKYQGIYYIPVGKQLEVTNDLSGDQKLHVGIISTASQTPDSSAIEKLEEFRDEHLLATEGGGYAFSASDWNDEIDGIYIGLDSYLSSQAIEDEDTGDLIDIAGQSYTIGDFDRPYIVVLYSENVDHSDFVTKIHCSVNSIPISKASRNCFTNAYVSDYDDAFLLASDGEYSYNSRMCMVPACPDGDKTLKVKINNPNNYTIEAYCMEYDGDIDDAIVPKYVTYDASDSKSLWFTTFTEDDFDEGNWNPQLNFYEFEQYGGNILEDDVGDGYYRTYFFNNNPGIVIFYCDDPDADFEITEFDYV